MHDPEALQRKLISLIMSYTDNPMEGLAVVAMTHMVIFTGILKQLKDDSGDKRAAELASRHMEILLKHFSQITEESGIDSATMGILTQKIQDKLKQSTTEDNFQAFVDALSLTAKKKPKPKSDTKILDQQVTADWTFKFPIKAWVKGKQVTLKRSENTDMLVQSGGPEVLQDKTQLQLIDEQGTEYLAYYYKKDGEFPLFLWEVK